jgi:hypothetical protein
MVAQGLFYLSMMVLFCPWRLNLVKGFTPALATRSQVLALFSATTNNSNTERLQGQKAKTTGGLRRLPVVKSPVELMNAARREAQRVKADRCVYNVMIRLE